MIARHGEPSFVELFTPKLFTILREGYGRSDFQADALAVWRSPSWRFPCTP